MNINGKKIEKVTVLGLGISGIAALKLAAKKGFSATGIDESDKLDLLKATSNLSDSISILPGFEGKKLPESDLIVISPGISDESRLGKLANDYGVPVISELDFASRFAEVPIVAITGTNGKTTVTEMTEMLLSNSLSAGNIGHPLSSAVLDKSARYLVVESSSFQLEKTPGFSPVAATVLNVSSDHMNRYSSFSDYTSAKFNIFNKVDSASNMIINYDLLEEWEKRRGGWNSIKPEDKPFTFSATSENADIKLIYGKVDLSCLGLSKYNLEDSEIKGVHNIENFMASVAMASVLISTEELKESVERLIHDFRLSSHRQEVIAEKDGVMFVNDSKATNPHAVIAALELFSKDRNICLIAGGLDKDMDFSLLLDQCDKIKMVFLIGESKEKMKKSLSNKIDCSLCVSLEEAVKKSTDFASKGDVVLLSPGCASMDMFKDYKERGEIFKKIILQSIV